MDEKRYTHKQYARVGDKIRMWVQNKNRWSDELMIIKLTPLAVVVQIPSNKNTIKFYRKHFLESDEFIFSSYRSIDFDPNKITEIESDK